MKIFLLFTLVVSCSLLILPVTTQARIMHKDSIDYMLDDGEFSPEEKDDEAENIRYFCSISAYQSVYYDCSCLAGAFRLKRDEEKLRPQSHVLSELYQDTESSCANPIAIAGKTYTTCMETAKNMRFKETPEEHDKYCTCYSNKVASLFSEAPRMNTDYISALHSQAVNSCMKEYPMKF